MTKKDNIYLILIGVLLLVITFLSIYNTNQKQEEPTIVTVEVRDTITIDSVRIIEHCVPLYVKEYDTIYVPNDTIKDTIQVLVPISQYEYKDTIVTDSSRTELDIRYSGYKATLDKIDINYHSTKEVSLNPKKLHIKPSFNIGIGGGYGAGYKDGTIRLEPQVGIYGTVGFSVVKY